MNTRKKNLQKKLNNHALSEISMHIKTYQSNQHKFLFPNAESLRTFCTAVAISTTSTTHSIKSD